MVNGTMTKAKATAIAKRFNKKGFGSYKVKKGTNNKYRVTTE